MFLCSRIDLSYVGLGKFGVVHSIVVVRDRIFYMYKIIVFVDAYFYSESLENSVSAFSAWKFFDVVTSLYFTIFLRTNCFLVLYKLWKYSTDRKIVKYD